MDSKSSTKFSQNSVEPDRSDRSSGEPVHSTPAVTDDTVEPSPARQPQDRVFTLFKRLPAELRLLIWEFACASHEPRIHFLEPIADTDDEARGPFWHRHRSWRDVYCPESESTPIIHWEISERTKDPYFQWPGKQLLSVCNEARRVYLDQETTSRREKLRVGFPDMDPTTDVICVRAGFASRGYYVASFLNGMGERETGYCYPDERPSPRRLALEIPVPTDHPDFRGLLSTLMPQWLKYYGRKQKFMQFHQLETVYLLDQHIKPRAHYHHQEDMPTDTYTESFDGHHGSKFVSIDPEDKQAVQSWNIPEHCWNILRCVRPFPHFLNLFGTSNADTDHNQRIIDGSLPRAKMRFLACVRESSQAQQLDDESPDTGFAFT